MKYQEVKNMYLKFIGASGSMGFVHGRVYDVEIANENGFIYVYVKYRGPSCPYSSPQSFAANWTKP